MLNLMVIVARNRYLLIFGLFFLLFCKPEQVINDLPPLLPPGNVKAKAGDATVTITFNASANAETYNIYWSTSSPVTTADKKETTTANTFVQQNLINNTTYYYAVTAVKKDRESKLSTEVNATPTGPVGPPQPPQNVQALAGDSKVTVTFDASPNAVTYNIYWSQSSPVTTGDNKETTVNNSFEHQNLINNLTYYYAITAVNANGESGLSKEVNAIPNGSIIPAKPKNVKAVAGDSRVTITFDASPNATLYYIYWAQTPNVTTASNKDSTTNSSFEHKNLTNGISYYYAVSAVNKNGSSELSDEVSATPNNSVLPQPPEKVWVVERDQKVTVEWSPGINANSYNLYWSLQPNITLNNDKISVNGIFHIHKGLTNGTPYYYAVTSLNSNGESGLSPEVKAIPHNTTIPLAPQNVQATAGDKVVSLVFDTSMYAKLYCVYWSLQSPVTTADNKDTTDTNSYEHVNLTNGTTYYYAISAINDNGESPLSTEVKAKPTNSQVPPAPENPRIQKKDGALLISWDPSPTAFSYHLYWANSPGITLNSNKIEHVTDPYKHEGLTNGLIYYYALTAVNAWGESDLSVEIHAIPNEIVIANGMALIEAGGKTFKMGSALGSAEEKPVHDVSFTNNFWMDTSEVTQKGYEALMKVNPSLFKGENLPVENLSWFDAVLYCNERSKRDSLDTVFTYTAVSGIPGNGCTGLTNFKIEAGKNGYRLPSEAQWEFACRSGTTTEFFWGKWSDSVYTSVYVWYTRNSELKTHSIGEKRSNEYILYDICGNVWEWCNDWYSEKYYSVSPGTDPVGPDKGSYRSIRGGSYYSGVNTCRSASRGYLKPAMRSDLVGFRCIKP